MKEININYKPWGPQLDFHESEAKFRGFIGGLGSGKTHAGVIESIRTIFNYPKSTGVILAPTYPILRDSTIIKFFEHFPRDMLLNYNKSENTLSVLNGTRVLFRPGNDTSAIDRLRNTNVDWFWLDEAALFNSYVWKVMVGRLRGTIGPRKGWLTTTPKGFNWIYEKFVEKPTKEYNYFTAKSIDNPYLPEDYIESIKSEYSGVFAKQEIYGEFVGFEGVVYPLFSRNIHVKSFEYTIIKKEE